MTDLEIQNFSTGNIGVMDRVFRVVLGMAAIIFGLYASMNSDMPYTWFKLIGAVVVLTGIAGWDPLYAAFRRLTGRITTSSISMGNAKPTLS